MPNKVVLAVGVESSQLQGQSSAWSSAGYSITAAASIPEAIGHLRAGDFDLVLLDHSMRRETRERLTFLIRASGSHAPVICMANPLPRCSAFAVEPLHAGPAVQLNSVVDLLAAQPQGFPATARRSALT